VTAELQRLVDALAERTERPAVLEDRRQRMIAYSRHDEPLDRVRAESILRRRTTPEIVAWLRQYGIAEASHAVRTPAAPHLGLLPRVCVPLRHHGMLLGYLWFVDADASMPDEAVDIADAAAGDFALAMYRENLAEELANNRESEAIRNLLVAETKVQSHAAHELIEGGQFHQTGEVTALVALPVQRDAEVEPDDLLRLAIEQALVDTRRRTGPRRTLHLVRYDHGLLLVADAADDEVRELAQTLCAALEQTARGLDEVDRIVVGVGAPRPHLARARESYEDARQAASVAVQLPVVGPIAEWARLGVYRALVHLSSDDLHEASLHEGLGRLLGEPTFEPLVHTLEVYLDLAGNVQATSERLNLHRTSLYYRLQRIETVAATDLRDGNERLALHLGLKLARLTGRR
jgi:hypothetical protein